MKESNRKRNKIWADKGSEFYNNYFKKWLKDNDVEIQSIHNEGKSVTAERLVRTLKNKIFKYNNTFHRTIKMKPIDVKDNTYVDLKKKLMIKIQNLELEIM